MPPQPSRTTGMLPTNKQLCAFGGYMPETNQPNMLVKTHHSALAKEAIIEL
jgi:hypothetical protein